MEPLNENKELTGSFRKEWSAPAVELIGKDEIQSGATADSIEGGSYSFVS